MVLELEFIHYPIKTTYEERGVLEIVSLPLHLFPFSSKNSGREMANRVHPSSFKNGQELEGSPRCRWFDERKNQS
jgi:hypothetical protein